MSPRTLFTGDIVPLGQNSPVNNVPPRTGVSQSHAVWLHETSEAGMHYLLYLPLYTLYT